MSVEHRIGTECFVDSVSPSTHFAAVFEEDGDTGYFYALDTSLVGQQILHALHVYDVGRETARGDVIRLEIVWSADGLHAGLKGDGQLRAVLDFSSSTSWQRDAVADTGGLWQSLAWDSKVEAWFT